MNRSSVLSRAAYAVCRFLVHERDLPALLQGFCDRVAGQGPYSSALLVLLDQMPRNAFRGTAAAFAGDLRARAVAKTAIANASRSESGR